MNSEAIALIKKLTKNKNLDDYCVVSKELDSFCLKDRTYSLTLLKILFVSLNFKQNEMLANEILIDLIPYSNLEELVILFKKINIYNEKFISICKNFSTVNMLKPIINEIFKKMNITFEEAGIYNLDALDKTKRDQIIMSVLKTINSNEFKNNKKIIKSIIRDNIHLMPSLDLPAYRNLREIKCLDLVENVFSPIHPSEIVRIEYLKKINNFFDFFHFLKINQIITDPTNRLDFVGIFKQKVEFFVEDGFIEVYVDLIYHGIILKMIKSKNYYRRHLGSLLLFSIIERIQDSNIPNIIESLIFDTSSEIRKTASAFINYIKIIPATYYKNLFGEEFQTICAASIFLKDLDPEIAMRDLSGLLNTNKNNIFGLMYHLNNINYTDPKYVNLVSEIYQKYKNSDYIYSWRIIRECCALYRNINDFNQLMKILLETDHLGVILFLEDMKFILSQNNINSLLKAGVDEIFTKNKNSRKSGGLSCYFLKLIETTNSYLKIKKVLLDLIIYDTGSQFIIRDMPTHTIFHVLNIFISFCEKVDDDLAFYFLVGFSCMNHSSFSIKNCGFSLLSLIFKKILFCQKNFDSFFIINRTLRNFLLKNFKNAKEKNNHQSLYFSLFIYERMSSLNKEELDAIENTFECGEHIQLRAQTIFNRYRFKENAPDRLNMCLVDEKDRYNFDFDDVILDDKTTFEVDNFAKLLISLNSTENATICSKKYSCEAAIHKICKIIKKRGLSIGVLELIKAYINRFSSFGLKDNIYNPDLDFDYIFEIINE